VDLKITEQVLKSFSDKDSRKPHYRELYETQDFLAAYAKHTDLRVAENPKGAIGREDEWESHGAKQLAFLLGEGLRRDSRLLDVGCGVGRGARRFVPFLDADRYTGIDISAAALEHALTLSEAEGWAAKRPRLLLNSDLDVDGVYDFIFAHSVFTHLPPQQIEIMIANAKHRLAPGGRFLFSYKAALKVQRSGLKQFQMPASFFASVASRNGLHAEPLSYVWPAHQRSMRLTHAAPAGDEDEEE
jgi:SAM-dependent methyltransferase